jgi:FkbM family methyltransferase
MLSAIRTFLYRKRLLRPYSAIDNFRYLKRLGKPGRDSDGGLYFSDKDRAQYPPGGEVLVRFRFRNHGCRMVCRPRHHVEAGLLRDIGHALRLQEMIADFLGHGVFVDVGANVGTFSVPLAKAFPATTVIAFEPNPPAHECLARNVALNGLRNVVVRAEGVGESPGTLVLYGFAGEDLGQSSFLRPTRHSEVPREIPVPVVRLDDVLAVADRPIDAIKIDVQGQELAVLRGARMVIERHRPPVLLEHEDTNFAQPAEASAAKQGLAGYFAAAGYEVFYVSRKDPDLLFPVRWDQPLNGDLLALPAGTRPA